MVISDEEKEDQKRMEECEEAEKKETVKEELKVLARRIRENSGINWIAENRNRPSGAPIRFGCEICNGKIEQPDPFSNKENPGLCDDCSKLVVRLAAK